MGLKDVLIYIDKTEEALDRLRLAVNLVSRHSSRLTALYIREWSPAQLEQRKTAELGLASATGYSRLVQISRCQSIVNAKSCDR